MKHTYNILLILGFFNLFPASGLFAQPWTLVKENDGIKIYTRLDFKSSWKSFKGEVTFSSPIEKVCAILGNDKNRDWWDKAITDVKVLGYEENKFIQYYLVYTLPWPFTNRDIVTETRITDDTVTGIWIYSAKPLPNRVPEKSDLVRIKHFSQKWTVQPVDNGEVHVIFEGSVDPGGNIPAWLYNMVITETPMKMLHSLRDKALSGKLADK